MDPHGRARRHVAVVARCNLVTDATIAGWSDAEMSLSDVYEYPASAGPTRTATSPSPMVCLVPFFSPTSRVPW